MMEAYIISALLAVVGIYCVAVKTNLIKKIIGLSIFTNSVHVLLIATGYREGGWPPIMTPGNAGTFALNAVDPLPQALVLTSIVIQLSVTALALSIAMLAYRYKKTLDTEKMKELGG